MINRNFKVILDKVRAKGDNNLAIKLDKKLDYLTNRIAERMAA
jgi:hypothetical protein